MAVSRVHIKKSKVSSDADISILNDMFAQMTGTEHADPDIIIPKIIKVTNLLSKYSKMYRMFLNFTEFINSFPEYDIEFKQILEFVDKLDACIDIKISEKLSTMDKSDINNIYKQIKALPEVQTIIITSGALKKYNRYLENKDTLSDLFIKREPGLTFKPIKFTTLDLKILWCSDKLSSMAKKYILSILSNTLLFGHEIYRTITSPDIDIKKFSKVLLENIGKLKKQIPRCDKAFDIITDSVTLLEDNFDGYYKTSVESSNPSIIIESFIVDVSMSQKSNTQITMQFKKIIMFMKKQTSNNKDPRVAKLFSLLNSQFNMMQKQNNDNIDDPAEDLPDVETTDDRIPDVVETVDSSDIQDISDDCVEYVE